MSDLRLSDLSQVDMPIDRSVQNLLLDDGTNTHRVLLNKLLGSGSGAANSLVFREEITEITSDMYDGIDDGSFNLVHPGMHYTAPSRRTYFMAHADYFYGHGGTENTNHHMLMIEDEITTRAQHQTTNITTGGANASLIYTNTLPSIQAQLEEDFGADHILPFQIYLTNAVTNGAPSGEVLVTLKAALMNISQVMGSPLGMIGAGENHNRYLRERQFVLFEKMPETIIARRQDNNARDWWWCDDVASASGFAYVSGHGFADNGSASATGGVRRAFLIGKS